MKQIVYIMVVLLISVPVALAHQDEARNLLDSKQWAKAEAAYDNLLKSDPNNPVA